MWLLFDGSGAEARGNAIMKRGDDEKKHMGMLIRSYDWRYC